MKNSILVGVRHLAALLFAIVVFVQGLPVYAQSVALALSSGSSAPSGLVTMNLSSTATSTQTGSLEWTLTYPPADLTVQSVSTGAALTAAGKSATCNLLAGSAVCVASGATSGAIPDGVIATVTFQVAANPSANSLGVAVATAAAASLGGDAVSAAGTGGNITVTAPAASVTGISCTPASLVGPGSVSCSVTLDQAAPTGGTPVALQSSSTALTVPPSVTVPEGHLAATFTGTASSVPAATTVNLVASASAVVSTSIAINPPASPTASTTSVAISSLVCGSATVTATAAGSCTLTLAHRVTSKTSVTLTSNLAVLAVPASVSVPANSNHAQFAISTTSPTASGTASITATLGSSSAVASANLGPTATAPLSPTATTSSFQPIRVKAGGGNVIDAAGVSWSADTGYLNGIVDPAGVTVQNTRSPMLYTNARGAVWGDPTLHYRFTVPNASYRVTLKFAELHYYSAGARVFNVVANGAKVLSAFDPFSAAGGRAMAVDRAFSTVVANGRLTLDFLAIAGLPQVCAIEIVAN